MSEANQGGQINLINARDRLPVFQRVYWVKCDGQKKLLSLHEFDRALRYYDEVFWVEEPTDVFVPAKCKAATMEFKKDDLEHIEVNGKEQPKQLTSGVRFGALLQENAKQMKTIEKPVLKIAAKETTKKLRKTPIKVRQRALITQKARSLRNAFVLKEEYGDYPEVQICNFNNPICPFAVAPENSLEAFVITLCFKEREQILDLINGSFYGRIEPIWSPFRIRNVYHLFPELRQRGLVPENLLSKLEWVYGKTGLQIIQKRLHDKHNRSKKQILQESGNHVVAVGSH